MQNTCSIYHIVVATADQPLPFFVVMAVGMLGFHQDGIDGNSADQLRISMLMRKKLHKSIPEKFGKHR